MTNLERDRDVAHDLLEFLRHVVQQVIGEHYRVFEQTVGIDIGQQTGHGFLPVDQDIQADRLSPGRGNGSPPGPAD